MKRVKEDAMSDVTCGNVILIGRQAGCYYTHISGPFLISECCDHWELARCSRIDKMLVPEVIQVPLALMLSH